MAETDITNKNFSCTIAKLNIPEKLTERSSPGGSKKVRRFKSIYGAKADDIRKGSILCQTKMDKVSKPTIKPPIITLNEIKIETLLQDKKLLYLLNFPYKWDPTIWKLQSQNQMTGNTINLMSMGKIQSIQEYQSQDITKLSGYFEFDPKNEHLGNIDIYIRASITSVASLYPQDAIKINISEMSEKTHFSISYFDKNLNSPDSVDIRVLCEVKY
ncbi:unnamed protein product [Gordionus sp. m RMFG-2023]